MATGYGFGFPVVTFFDDNGLPLNNGKVYTYAAGTSTPIATYSDSALTVPNANPIRPNAAGRATIYGATGTGYKFDVFTSADVAVYTEDFVSLVSVSAPPAPAAVPTGSMLPYGAAAAPSGYLLCDGTAVDRTTYAPLFAVIATTWGAGNGTTTFNVPDMRGKFPLGKSTAGTGSTLGASGGLIDHTHTGPSHTHSVTTSNHTHTGPSHTHTATINGGTSAPSATQGDTQGGSGSLPASGTHTHTVIVTGTTDAGGTGNTSSAGGESLTSGAGGTGATGTANPPFASCQWIIKI